MADEVRRSGRATKGQHTKNVEGVEGGTPVPKGKRGKAKASKRNSPEPSPASEDGEPAIIRCACGCVVEDEDEERPMIACDECEAWQHLECMGMSEDPADAPENYFCEQCKPENHKELLIAIAKGQKPWIVRAEEREREELEKKSRKRKGGKRGKKARVSDIKTKTVEPEAFSTPLVQSPLPHKQATPETKPKVESNKRKLPDMTVQTSAFAEPEPLHKMRKVSSPQDVKSPTQRRKSSLVATPVRRGTKGAELQTELVRKISDLQSEVRKRTATALVKLFVDSTQQAQKQGTFKVPLGQTVDDFGLELGLAVEYAIYFNFWGLSGDPKPEYADKMRMVLHNVKANPTLRDQLLTGSLSPNDFSNMSSFQMASKELQEKTAAMIKEVEKQHMLVQQDGPRIRRTHKGEELVGDDSQHLASTEQTYSTTGITRRRESEYEASQASPNDYEMRDAPFTGSSGSGVPLPPLDTKTPTTKFFNNRDVWSNLDSANAQQQSYNHDPNAFKEQYPAGSRVQADADIDNLLKDEEPDEEEPYSPTDYQVDDGTVWHGKVCMANVAEFRGAGKHVAGADLHEQYPWSKLMPPTVIVEGRIAIDAASSYLCGLQWSKTTDVSVVAITPSSDPKDQSEFDKLFQYFTTRSRFGVIVQSAVDQVRDIYVVPLEAGTGNLPEFVELLEECTLENPRPTRSMLFTYVIKASPDAPSSTVATPSHAETATPVTTQPVPQYANSLPAHMSPMTPHTTPGFGPPPRAGPTPTLNDNRPKGLDAARIVLGDLVSSPSIQKLLTMAPTTGLIEFEQIKEVLDSVPAARADMDMLLRLLTEKLKGTPLH